MYAQEAKYKTTTNERCRLNEQGKHASDTVSGRIPVSQSIAISEKIWITGMPSNTWTTLYPLHASTPYPIDLTCGSFERRSCLLSNDRSITRLGLKMCRPTLDIVKGRVLQLFEEKNSYSVIMMKLRQSGTTLSKGAVSGIINRHLNRIEEVNGGQPQSRKRKVNSVRTPEVIKKIKKFTQVTDPIR